MQKCVVRLLENWDASKMYLASAVKVDKLKSAEKILPYLNNECIKAHLLFLKYTLNFFNSFNAVFQSRKVLIHQLTEQRRLLISQFGNNFMKREVLKQLESGTLDVSHASNFLPLEEIIVGPECERCLNELPPTYAREIREICLQFYITAVKEMQKRLPLKPSFLDDLRFLALSVALNFEERRSVRDLSAIAERFGEFDVTKLAFEWNTLPSAFTEEETETPHSRSTFVLERRVMQSKNLGDEPMLATLDQLVNIVLSLPHSKAEAERVFSIVTDVKTKKRNKIGSKCLNAIYVFRSAFKNAQVDCRSFEVDAQHLELHSSEHLYPPQQVDH